MLALLVLHHAKLLASNQSILALGVAPMRVVSRWCRCIVQRLCATDCKRPCLVRAAAPHSAPARTPGVYAQRLCTMQSQPSIHSLSRGEGVWGFGKDAEIERPKALCKDAYKWSNKVGAGRTDNKRPRLQRRKAHKAFL